MPSVPKFPDYAHLGLPILLISGCVLGDPNPNGDEDWNPLQGAASLGDAAPSAETSDPAEPAGAGGGGGGDGGDASTEELNDALEDVEAGLFTNIAADAMYVVTQPIQEVTYSPGSSGSSWSVDYASATCDAAGDILLSGGCSAMTIRQTIDYNYADNMQNEYSMMGSGSFPLVEGGVPTGWSCGKPAVMSGVQNLGNGYTVTYGHSVLEPAEIFVVCLAVE